MSFELLGLLALVGTVGGIVLFGLSCSKRDDDGRGGFSGLRLLLFAGLTLLGSLVAVGGASPNSEGGMGGATKLVVFAIALPIASLAVGAAMLVWSLVSAARRPAVVASAIGLGLAALIASNLVSSRKEEGERLASSIGEAAMLRDLPRLQRALDALPEGSRLDLLPTFHLLAERGNGLAELELVLRHPRIAKTPCTRILLGAIEGEVPDRVPSQRSSDPDSEAAKLSGCAGALILVASQQGRVQTLARTVAFDSGLSYRSLEELAAARDADGVRALAQAADRERRFDTRDTDVRLRDKLRVNSSTWEKLSREEQEFLVGAGAERFDPAR